MTLSEYPDRTVFNGTQLCVAEGCAERRTELGETRVGDRPRVVIRNTDLCRWHHQKFGRLLADLVVHLGTLETSVVRTGGGDGMAVQTSGVSDVSSRWNTQVSTVLADMVEWVDMLERIITTERVSVRPPWEVPAFPTGVSDRVRLAFIRRVHAAWLSGYPTLGPSLLADAATLSRQAARAIEGPTVRRVPIDRAHAVCTHLVLDEDGGIRPCGGSLVGLIRSGTGRRQSEIVCEADSSHPQIPRDQWMELGDGR